jgi:transcriptional regulator with XRE-family HTH domain
MSGNTSFTPHVAFGQVLRKHRLAAGLSQEQLSLEADVQRNFISLIETGQNQPTITTIFKLAAALNIKPSQLISDSETLLTSQ